MNSARSLGAVVSVLAFFLAVPPARAVMDATTECLVGFLGVPDDAKNGGTVMQGATNGVCTFNLTACANRAEGSCTGTALKPIKVKGRCQGASALGFAPAGDTASCGTPSAVTVKLKRHGNKPGKCKIVALAKSSTKPRRVDKDVLMLTCSTGTPGPACSLPTTCTPGANVMCEPLVNDGQGIAGTYQMLAVQGPKLCQTNSQKNRFGPCSTEADCGGQQGITQLCSITPFATADGVVLPFPQGIKTVFTITQPDPPPTCNHTACIACGNMDAACAGLEGCGTTAGQPAPGCIRNQCCDQPGFTIPTFTVPLLGGLCSSLRQYRPGFGAVNSSNPQSGDNEVTKTGDTSDPGPDCIYGTSDDPPKKSCDTTSAGAGNDLKAKVQRCVGNGVCDSQGIHYRLAVPSISTTWQDSGRTPQGLCPDGAKFDAGELAVTQLLLNAEFTTAGATSSFADLNGDGCALAGAGFTNFNKTGPFTIGSPPAAPQPYDSSGCGSGVCSTAVSAGVVFTGGGPLYDTGFMAVLTNGAMTRLPTQACPNTQVEGCPE